MLSSETAPSMNLALRVIANWSATWGLQFNPTKCKLLLCAKDPAVYPIPPNYRITLNTHIIEQTRTFRYLGVTLSDDGSWQPHMSKLYSSCSWVASHIIRVARSGQVRPLHIYQLLKAHILPRITYGWPIWSPSTQSEWDSLTRLVVAPVQRAFGLCSTTSFATHLHLSGITPLRLIFHQRVVGFYTKLQQEPCPIYMQAFLDCSPSYANLFPRKSWLQRSPSHALQLLLPTNTSNSPFKLSPNLNLSQLLPHLYDPPPSPPCFIVHSATFTSYSNFLKFATKNYFLTSSPPIHLFCSHCPLCQSPLQPDSHIYAHLALHCFKVAHFRQPITDLLISYNIPTTYQVMTCHPDSPLIPPSIKSLLSTKITILLSQIFRLLCYQVP